MRLQWWEMSWNVFNLQLTNEIAVQECVPVKYVTLFSCTTLELVVGFAQTSYTVDEGAGSLMVTIQSNLPIEDGYQLIISTLEGTASSECDWSGDAWLV